jgi:hypothetical protein
MGVDSCFRSGVALSPGGANSHPLPSLKRQYLQAIQWRFLWGAVFSQLRQGIVTNFGTLISPNFGRVISLTSAGVNSSNQSCVRLHQHNGQLHKSKQAFLVRSPQALSRCG